mmetsp:Transcript_42126/g.82388  ORF Transcript_42126/g.82388 Transcript_42126/m.82388 type:complete len:280 (-) Transcript_42126:106-945(-)
MKDEKALQFTRLMICDALGFYLVLCDGGHAARCVLGGWDDAGSEEAVVDFLVRGFQTEEWSRLWLASIRALCTEFNVQLVTPCEEAPTCFLGSGACGRVFRVRSVEEDQKECALKVGLGDDASSAIHEEWSKFQSFSAKFGSAGEALIMILSHFQSPDRAFTGIVLAPVGSALPRTQKAIKSALAGLMLLSKAGFGHGDARICNVVWVDSVCSKWLDLRTMYECEEDTNKEKAFVGDATKFFDSFKLDRPDNFSDIAGESFTRNDVNLVTDLFKNIWST